MILRRLADAIREQNWFTVFIEVLVVVVGIFIGLQVDDWSQYRQDRRDELLYLDRLHGEMMSAEKLSARLLKRRIERQQVAVELVDAVFGSSGSDSLSDLECQTISSMHFFNIAVSGLSAVDELTASGRMGILRNTELRAALGALKQAHEAVGTYIRIQNEVANDLTHLYPDLIRVEAYFDTSLGEIYSRVTCDLPGMRKNQAFLNDFSNNADVYDAYVRDGVAPWAGQMQRVHELLDRNLGLQQPAEEHRIE
ncbi:MAG: hypothetical protein OEV41_07335 [Gammaproteobacteria bacterium]|nr:hypothetical protein [Gammaproteobacteria bacterium]MDH5344140.1 hypothetical protein [Gammaproteobacteria bacterium]